MFVVKDEVVKHYISNELRLLSAETYMACVHAKYYTEKNNNNNGINYNVLIDDTMDRVYINPFLFVLSKNDEVISDCLKSTGYLYEKCLISIAKQFIEPTKNVLDIGANIGCHTIPYSTYTSGAIYAFEPQPKVFELLQKNIQSNNCNTIYPFNFGASDRDDLFFMNARYDYKLNQGGFKICSENEAETGIYIECKKLDLLNLSNIGYIKMDVEGHEMLALLGLEETIRSNLPNLMIEIHDSSTTKNDVFIFIIKMGYKFYYKLSHCDYIFSFHQIQI
jgi:FkbM family methyltransferase